MAVLLIAFIITLLAGLPVFLSLTGASLLYVELETNMPGLVVLHRIIGGMDSFPLLAIPFFILCGNLMNESGISDRIFAFCRALMGWAAGGLGYVVVVAAMIFAGMTGAAVAEAGGLGVIALGALRKAEYDDEFSVGLISSSATIGPIIPPSLPMVIYGVLASVSIGALFAAGFIPGLLMGVGLMIAVNIQAKRRKYPKDVDFSIKELFITFIPSILPLMTPVIIIGGMLSGLFTPTEAAIAAVFYALILGVFIYRTLNLSRLIKISMETVETTAVLTIIIGCASAFGWMLTSSRATEYFARFLISISGNNIYILLLIMNCIFFFFGFFMEAIASITILVPVLLPVAVAVGIDPLHFGVLMVLNLMIGLLTPPVGGILFVMARVSNFPLERVAKSVLPFLIPLIICLAIITFFPKVVLFVPNMLVK